MQGLINLLYLLNLEYFFVNIYNYQDQQPFYFIEIYIHIS